MLFFLALALFLHYSGILLFLNSAQFYLAGIPSSTAKIIELLISVGITVLPALLIHTHLAYGRDQLGMPWRWWHTTLVIFAYLPAAGFGAAILQNGFSSQDKFGGLYATPNMTWLIATIIICVALQTVFARRASPPDQRTFHSFFAVYFAAVGLLAIRVFIAQSAASQGISFFMYPATGGLDYWMLIGVIFAWVLPLAVVVYAIVRYQALGLGSQKSLVYSVSIAFLAVLYLSVVRRVSGWAEPYFPPEATAGFLLFLLLAFFEPLQRLASRLLRRGFQEQVDRLQRLSAELQREALRGESGRLIEFAEEHIRQEFGLESVRIHLNSSDLNSAFMDDEQRRRGVTAARPAWAGRPVRLRLGKPGAEMGDLEVVPVGSAISGEASAALDFLAEQLPAVIELCRVIEQKVALERELDERERMALVGQMAASISHNLKNPLGSMKTILQVQLENSSLPVDARRDLSIVLSELDRLSVKLNQLLQYARPAVRASSAPPSRVDVGAVAEQVISLLRHDAERRVSLTLNDESAGAFVAGSQDALADILSNLVVNAIEAMADGGAISVGVTRDSGNVVLTVSDDGPGIPAQNRANVFRPFFTTKPSGTGLGLAIAERRVTELGGSITCESSAANGRGAKFIVRLPLIDIGK